MIRSYIQRMGQRNPDCVFERLDPRCKLIVVLVVTLLSILGNASTSAVLFAVAGIVACWARLGKLFIVMTGSAMAFWLVLHALTIHVLHQPVDDPADLLYGVVFRGVSLGIMGFWFATTTKLRDLTAALEAWRVPRVVTLPLTVAARFLPTLLQESMLIRDAMKLRRLTHRRRDIFLKPHLIGQSYAALVIVRSLKMADELAVVAETRGLGRPGKHRSYRRVGLRKKEYCIIGGTVAAALMMIAVSYWW